MAKEQEFIVYNSQGGSLIFKTTSFARAAKLSGWANRPGFITSISVPVKGAARFAKKVVSEGTPSFEVDIGDGIKITALKLDQLNKILEMLGYKAIRETSNMLNREAGTFFIDEDTPSYCDPGCEAYHSM